MSVHRLALSLLALVCVQFGAVRAQAAPPALEQSNLSLAVGGQGLFYYLPLTIAVQRGYFKEAGLTIEVVDFPGGAKSLQALVGGSAEVAAGSFEHVINMRARGQALVAIALLARYPAIVLALKPDFAAHYHSPADLRGHTVGITAPGSSTHMFLNNVLARAGVAPADVPVIGVGTGASAVAAMRRGELDALVHLDPVIHQLEASGDAKVVIDTRNAAGATAVYGGAYHAACLYTKQSYIDSHPNTLRALVGAQLRALEWLAKASDEDIAAAVPPAYWGGDRAGYIAALAANRAMWSPDGKLDVAGAQKVLDTLAAFEPSVRDAAIDVRPLLDNRFVDSARP
jgi:NitT/TauT family transport system substrate-binding protein